MTHGRAAALMVLVTLMWSIAGMVTRHLESARSFEVTFWRSAFTAGALLIALWWMRGGAGLWREIRDGGRWMWLSALCWMTMYTAFMVAITMAPVATVLVTLSIAPLLTALFARLFLRHRIAGRTWAAMVAAALGIAWMFGQQAIEAGSSMTGAIVAFGVPLAAATNWTLLQFLNQRQAADPTVHAPDMLVAVLLGALLSTLFTAPLSWPLQATDHDVRLLALLGVVQLAIPCLLAVWLAKVLPAPEISLISLLEVIFGVLLVWLGAGEAPEPAALQGGALVVGALVANELAGMRERAAQSAT